MRTSAWVIAAAAAGAVTFVAIPVDSLRAQGQSSSSAPQATFRAATNLVEVDVVVLDREGRFVPGLTVEDLDVYEDGKRQVVQQFYLVTSGADSTATSPATRAASDPRGRRIFVFVFDEEHLSTESLTRLKVGAERFLNTLFQSGDVGGVYSKAGMHRGRLTGDRIELAGGIRSVSPTFENRDTRLLAFREFPAIPSEADAVRIDHGDARRVDELTTRACRDNPAECAAEGGMQLVASKLEDKAKYYVREARTATQNTLRTLRLMASSLGTIPGRKTMVFLTDGFFSDEVRSELQQIAAVAARGGIAIYSIYGRGSAVVAGRALPDVLTSETGLTSSLDSTNDGPEILTSATGGFVLRNINDVSRALGLVARDTSTYYVLGYQPDNAVMDGKVRKIEVKSKSPDLRIRSRKGYVASPLGGRTP